uniref:DUF1977 domain-containing protein n=1 Tax=Hemiselmis andersenii TaxID=464988 RepID=A0A6U2HDS7_HEMAN|mmetsp:Transcript_40373/g.94515  ORF Transcript_40373/g.94515 Transcript_40373/m.94515 type:complete len:238 (+) Transcript_40373:278-991(+)
MLNKRASSLRRAVQDSSKFPLSDVSQQLNVGGGKAVLSRKGSGGAVEPPVPEKKGARRSLTPTLESVRMSADGVQDGWGGEQLEQQQQQRQQQQHHAPQEAGFAQLIQLLPLLLLFLFTFFNFGGESSGSALYTLSRDATHPVRRTTDGRGVHYFVKGGFEREIQMRYGSAWIGELETKIENDKLMDLRTRCESDTRDRQRRAKGARREGDAQALRRAMRNDSEACAELYKVFPELH